jgi:translation initiation factor 2 subunit 2
MVTDLNEEEYVKLLDRAFSKIPDVSAAKSDFIIPKVESIAEGSKTMVRNISSIADAGRRKVSEIARYISKELGVPVGADEKRLVINGRFTSDDLNKRVARYFELYVVCKECKKPDTHLESAGGGMFYLVCEACGSRYAVKSY